LKGKKSGISVGFHEKKDLEKETKVYRRALFVLGKYRVSFLVCLIHFGFERIINKLKVLLTNVLREFVKDLKNRNN